MKTLERIVSVELNESFLELAKRLGLDLKRYKPVRFEIHPFFSLYCIDAEMTKGEKEWITKFEVLPLDVDRIDELLEVFNLNISTDQKYLDKEPNKIGVIMYPEEGK